VEGLSGGLIQRSRREHRALKYSLKAALSSSCEREEEEERMGASVGSNERGLAFNISLLETGRSRPPLVTELCNVNPDQCSRDVTATGPPSRATGAHTSCRFVIQIPLVIPPHPPAGLLPNTGLTISLGRKSNE